MVWILLTLVYGLLKGTREIAKKKALQKNTVLEVLVLYTILSFLMVLPSARGVTDIDSKLLWPVLLKSAVIFAAWMFSFVAIKHMPISLVGVLDMSRVLFASLLGYAVLKEPASPNQIAGLVTVCVGLYALRFVGRREKKTAQGKMEKDAGGSEETSKPAVGIKTETGNGIKAKTANGIKAENEIGAETGDESKIKAETEVEVQKSSEELKTEQPKTIYIIMVFASCILNAISATLDKVLMKDMNSGQLQFWYMLFLVVFYLIYVLVTRMKLNWKSLLTNGWIWALSLMIVVADRCLFIANGISESRLTVMTLIKQTGCIVTIIGGKLIFHEKNILYKLFCGIIVIIGIVLAVL